MPFKITIKNLVQQVNIKMTQGSVMCSMPKTHCVSQFRVQTRTGQSVHTNLCPLPKAHMSIQTALWNGKWPGLKNHISPLASCGQPGIYMLLTVRKDGFRMRYVKKAHQGKQCDALASVPAGPSRVSQQNTTQTLLETKSTPLWQLYSLWAGQTRPIHGSPTFEPTDFWKSTHQGY